MACFDTPAGIRPNSAQDEQGVVLAWLGTCLVHANVAARRGLLSASLYSSEVAVARTCSLEGSVYSLFRQQIHPRCHRRTRRWNKSSGNKSPISVVYL